MPVTIASALSGAQQLATVSDSWRLDAELLLANALGKRREYLITHADQQLDATSLARFNDSLARRQQGEPIAYILGHKGFWDFDLSVTPAVLIPRPETELLVEAALEIAQTQTGETIAIADLGTGSGAVAIALARANRDWSVSAVDSSAEALAVASANADQLGAGHIEFLAGSWCEPLAANRYTIMVANPPYVAAGDSHLSRDGLSFEPYQALVAEADGLADLRSIVEQAPRCLKRDSWLLLEHGFQQAGAVAELLASGGFVDIRCRQDYAGNDRMTQARWPAAANDDSGSGEAPGAGSGMEKSS